MAADLLGFDRVSAEDQRGVGQGESGVCSWKAGAGVDLLCRSLWSDLTQGRSALCLEIHGNDGIRKARQEGKEEAT